MNTFTKVVIWIAALSILVLMTSSVITLVSAIWSCWWMTKIGLSMFVISLSIFILCEAATNSKHFQDD